MSGNIMIVNQFFMIEWRGRPVYSDVNSNYYYLQSKGGCPEASPYEPGSMDSVGSYLAAGFFLFLSQLFGEPGNEVSDQLVACFGQRPYCACSMCCGRSTLDIKATLSQ